MKQEHSSSFTGYQLFLIFGLSALLFTIVLDFMLLPALSAILMPALDLSTEQFGWVASAYAFSAGVSGLIASGFADRFDRKQFLLFFYGGFLLGLFLCTQADTYYFLFIARIITGLFGGVVGAICYAIITDLFRLEQRGQVMGFVQMAFAGGQVAGLPAALYLANTYSWQTPFYFIFTLGALICSVIFIKMRAVDAHLHTTKRSKPLQHIVKITSVRRYWIVFINNSLIVCADVLFMTFDAAFCTNNLGLGLEQLPIIYGTVGLTTLVCGPLIGRLADQLGKLRVFVVGTFLTATVVVVYAQLGHTPLWLIVLLHILIFIGVNARMIASTALGTAIPRSADRGAFMAIDASAQQLFAGVAAIAAGWMVLQSAEGTLQNYPTLAWAVVVIMLTTMSLMYRIEKLLESNS